MRDPRHCSVITSLDGVSARQSLTVAKPSSSLASDAKALVRLVSTAQSVTINATARITHLATLSAVSASANVAGRGKLATRSALTVTTVKTAKKNAQKTCRQKRLVITLQATSIVDPATSD